MLNITQDRLFRKKKERPISEFRVSWSEQEVRANWHYLFLTSGAQPGNITISITDKTTMASLQTTIPKSSWGGLAGPLSQTRLSKHIDTSQHTPPKHTHALHVHTLRHLRCRLRVPHVSCTQPPPPSNSILRSDIPTGAPIAATPTNSTVCGERAAIPDDTLNIRFPIMHLQAPSRFLHHAAMSKKQHVAQRNTWQSHSKRVNTNPTN